MKMGFPMYFLGLSIPFIAGFALVVLTAKMMAQNEIEPLQKYEHIALPPQRNNIKRRKIKLDKCAICLEEMTAANAEALDCGHIFHSLCIFALIKKQFNKCPICRTIFGEE